MIIALGLLVDVPRRGRGRHPSALADGLPRKVAAWLGPTRLATPFFRNTNNIIA